MSSPAFLTLEQLGREVARLRQLRGWTQQQLGDQVGMGQSTIARFERGGVAEFGAAKLLRILDALGHALRTIPLDKTRLDKAKVATRSRSTTVPKASN